MNRNNVYIGKFSWSRELWHNINVNLPGYFTALMEKYYVKNAFLHIVAGPTVKHSPMAGQPW